MRVFVFIQPVAMLVHAKIHLQIVESVLESPQRSAVLRAFGGDGRGTEGQRTFGIIAEVEGFILQLIEFLVLQPHTFAGWTVVDLELVPGGWRQVRIAFRTLQPCLRYRARLFAVKSLSL